MIFGYWVLCINIIIEEGWVAIAVKFTRKNSIKGQTGKTPPYNPTSHHPPYILNSHKPNSHNPNPSSATAHNQSNIHEAQAKQPHRK